MINTDRTPPNIPDYENNLAFPPRHDETAYELQLKVNKLEKENQQLKELLYSLKCCLTSQNIEPQIRVEKSLAKIENAIGEKK